MVYLFSLKWSRDDVPLSLKNFLKDLQILKREKNTVYTIINSVNEFLNDIQLIRMIENVSIRAKWF